LLLFPKQKPTRPWIGQIPSNDRWSCRDPCFLKRCHVPIDRLRHVSFFDDLSKGRALHQCCLGLVTFRISVLSLLEGHLRVFFLSWFIRDSWRPIRSWKITGKNPLCWHISFRLKSNICHFPTKWSQKWPLNFPSHSVERSTIISA
jgi:hypothetical protein